MGAGKRDAILVGDVGGTNTRLAIIEMVKGNFNFLAEETFPSREEPSLESALRKFLSSPLHPITRACLGVAGPVREGRCAVGDRFPKDSAATQPPPGGSDQ